MLEVVAAAGYDLRQLHFVEADMQTDGPCHEDVDVCADFSAE